MRPCVLGLLLCLLADTVFSSEQISLILDMTEETPVNTIIGSLTESLPVLTGNKLNYLVSHTYVKADPHTGRVQVARVVDRESICQENKLCCGVIACSFQVTGYVVYANPSELMASVNLTINVIDINDNPPTFGAPMQKVSFPENSPIGRLQPLRPATDADIDPTNRIQRYRLTERTDTFTLDQSHLPAIRLRSTRSLDREHVANYSAVLEACDRDSCAKSQLFIEIEDENDNSPQFERSQYSESLLEDIPVGSVILRLNATDADSGERAQVVYSLHESADPDLAETFEVANNGEVRLRRPLDAQVRSEYRFRVVACDMVALICSADANSTAEVIFTVQDINDHRPIIEVVPAVSFSGYVFGGDHSPQDGLSVPENSPPGQVAMIKVKDRDVGENARTFCELGETTNNFVLTQSSSSLYTLRTSRVFDYEREAIVTTTIKCRDSGSPPQSSFRVVTLRILDVNEFPPVFSPQVLHVQVSENSPAGLEIAKLTATDQDGQSHLRYSLLPIPHTGPAYDSNSDLGSAASDSYGDAGSNSGINRHFLLDPNSGFLRTSRIPLDRETVDRITLIATVTDATKGKIYTATATISVEVLDENDNSPVFVNPPANMGPSFPQDTIDSYAFNVRENSPPYTRLSGRLEARDPDAGQNGQVHFSLRSTWALKGGTQVHRSGFALDDLAGAPGRQLLDQRIFQITPEGGIETLVELDRESVSSYLLNVAVRDNGSQPLASTAMLLVLVLDENDNPPVWTFPTESARQINITTANQPGTLVARLQAYDIDADAAGTVEFQILDPHGQPMPPISLARGLYNAQPATPHTAEQSSTNQALSEIGSSLMGYRTGPFYLNGSTGEILVADTLVPMSLKIRIRASDCGPNPLYTDTWMIVNVQMDPDESAGFLGVGRAGALNVTIILVMIAVTAIISILLIIAIVCVRRKPARYNGVVQEGPDYASPCQTVCAGSPYIDPSKEALTSNTWSATIGSKDCSGTFYPQSGGPRSVPGQGSLVIDENGQVFSSVPLSYGSPVVCGSVMGTSDNTSLVCFPQPNSVSMISGTPYASDFNGDLSIGMPMHTFGTLTRNQRSTLGSLQGSTPAVRMGSGLQYEPPPLPDADSGDSGRGPSEDGNQLLLMDNQRNGLVFPSNSGAYQYGTYSGYRPSSRAGYGRSVSAMSGNINCTTPRSYNLQTCPPPMVNNCACYSLPEDQCLQQPYNEALYRHHSQLDSEGLYSSRGQLPPSPLMSQMMLPPQIPPRSPVPMGMGHRSLSLSQPPSSPSRRLPPAYGSGGLESGTLPRGRTTPNGRIGLPTLAQSSVTFQSPSLLNQKQQQLEEEHSGAAPIKLDLRGVPRTGGGGGVTADDELSQKDSTRVSLPTFAADGRPPSVPRGGSTAASVGLDHQNEQRLSSAQKTTVNIDS